MYVTIYDKFEITVHPHLNTCPRGTNELWSSTGCTLVHFTKPRPTFAKRVVTTSETWQTMRFRVFRLGTSWHSRVTSRVCHHIRHILTPIARTLEHLSKSYHRRLVQYWLHFSALYWTLAYFRQMCRIDVANIRDHERSCFPTRNFWSFVHTESCMSLYTTSLKSQCTQTWTIVEGVPLYFGPVSGVLWSSLMNLGLLTQNAS